MSRVFKLTEDQVKGLLSFVSNCIYNGPIKDSVAVRDILISLPELKEESEVKEG